VSIAPTSVTTIIRRFAVVLMREWIDDLETRLPITCPWKGLPPLRHLGRAPFMFFRFAAAARSARL
jgi:hypothetical protein